MLLPASALARYAMSSELHLLVNVAIAVAVALVGGLLAYALRQPAIVGYLLAGIAIGPFTPGASSATATRSPRSPRSASSS